MDKGFAVLEIDPEFKTLIRPLRKDEYLQLEVNLTVDGCREPIITWNNIIIDGHNRYEISGSRETPVWRMIYDSLDYKNEADIFANQMKHVRPLKPYEIFMAIRARNSLSGCFLA